MVIATSVRQKRAGLPSKRPFGSAYDITKAGFKTYGYYDKYQLWRYDPDYYYEKYIGKYTYKPRKRVAGYLGQKLHEKKQPTTIQRGQFGQKFRGTTTSSRYGSKYYKSDYSGRRLSAYSESNKYKQRVKSFPSLARIVVHLNGRRSRWNINRYGYIYVEKSRKQSYSSKSWNARFF